MQDASAPSVSAAQWELVLEGLRFKNTDTSYNFARSGTAVNPVWSQGIRREVNLILGSEDYFYYPGLQVTIVEFLFSLQKRRKEGERKKKNEEERQVETGRGKREKREKKARKRGKDKERRKDNRKERERERERDRREERRRQTGEKNDARGKYKRKKSRSHLFFPLQPPTYPTHTAFLSLF